MIFCHCRYIKERPEDKGEDRQGRSWRERMDAEREQRGRERPVARTRQGVILTRGAHSLITGFGLRSPGVRADPNAH